MKFVLLNNRSALECWETGHAKLIRVLADDDGIEFVSDADSLRLARSFLPMLGNPVETLVRRGSSRGYAARSRSRVWSKPLPAYSVGVVPGTNVAVSLPWFCYLQMAARLPFSQAVLLGMELCGEYSTLWFGGRSPCARPLSSREKKNGFIARPPLIEAADLLVRLKSYLGEDSESNALAAAKLILPNAYSPAEARHYIRLCAPVRRGGYGLPRPHANVRIPLSRRLAELAGRQEFVCDFLYPEVRLAIEYDGGYHWNGDQRIDDNLRELILKRIGIEVVRIDRHQSASIAAMDVCAQAIAGHLGLRLRTPSERSLARRAQMHAQLADYSFDLYG